MAKYQLQSDELDAMFAALADPTRRSVIARLGRGPASVGELAEPLSISLPSFMKHVRSLESCGLIRTKKSGRVRTCALNQDRLHLLSGWLEEQRRIREESTDRLEQFVTTGSVDSDGPTAKEES
ncbi:metalloregulator ArsR/SmtB family transcription factor [Brevibacterium sp. 'Marine']|uniref:ArsR/SmtB family transcription factor n=1 Tax=Brevibacterium sp. 'Marine' TaxID=2725563 RepID=UPI00145E5739|nr:metalloregulator ArsR/SmtB family transcription factor [Brevibacterium sp. 'Marine']